MSGFYVLEVGGFTQYKYAWYEPPRDARYGDDPPDDGRRPGDYRRCPACCGHVGGLYWLPPRQVVLKQPRRVGDFVFGPGGTDLLVSPRFRNAYERERLTGIMAVYPVEVTRMGTTRRAREYAIPTLFGIDLQHGPARVVWDEMGVVWEDKPQVDYCRTCGPGGGGPRGTYRSLERIALDGSSWGGEDFFYAINFSGVILISQRAREFIERHGFTNALIVPCHHYTYSFGTDCKLRKEQTRRSAVYTA